jgi:hypothetical protein
LIAKVGEYDDHEFPTLITHKEPPQPTFKDGDSVIFREIEWFNNFQDSNVRSHIPVEHVELKPEQPKIEEVQPTFKIGDKVKHKELQYIGFVREIDGKYIVWVDWEIKDNSWPASTCQWLRDLELITSEQPQEDSQPIIVQSKWAQDAAKLDF